MPLTHFGNPAPPPLIAGPVALMKLVEVDDVSEIMDDMRRMRLGPDDFSAETKFNGWLVQCAGGRLYSRRGNLELTRNFPEIARDVARYTAEHLAGELVYWTPEGLMDEPSVTRVAGTRDPREAVAKLRALPGRFEYVLFDAIAARGQDISRLPTDERQEILLRTVAETESVKISAAHPFEEWEAVYEAGVAAGGDGVVIKNRHAPHVWRPLGQSEPRPVGHWYKLKPVLTDDFVVFGTLRGPKGKLLVRYGQFHEGQLVEIGQVNNFSKRTEAEILERIQEGPFVVEFEFQGRFPDPPGALQHGRFVRFRQDKEPEDAVLPERYAPREELGAVMGDAAPEPGTWERCGNTLFYMKRQPHEIVGYTFIDPADYIKVTWEETPEGYVVKRREVPMNVDWAGQQLVQMKLDELPDQLRQRFMSWAGFIDIMWRRGLSPAKVVENFEKGYEPGQRNDLLDAMDKGLFAAEIPWVERTAVVSREDLDSALADFGVMECP